MPTAQPATEHAAANEPSPRPTSRRFEYKEGVSRKFWEVGTQGGSLTICFGRLGTAGQVREKTFDDAPRAEREMAKLIAEKTANGYVEKPPRPS
jgi:predicted DNA-binding WGR domain protein